MKEKHKVEDLRERSDSHRSDELESQLNEELDLQMDEELYNFLLWDLWDPMMLEGVELRGDLWSR